MEVCPSFLEIRGIVLRRGLFCPHCLPSAGTSGSSQSPVHQLGRSVSVALRACPSLSYRQRHQSLYDSEEHRGTAAQAWYGK